MGSEMHNGQRLEQCLPEISMAVFTESDDARTL